MVDIHSPATPMTVRLPADLLMELRALAAEKQVSLDEVVQEACLAYTEPNFWERCSMNWLKEHPLDVK